ncbi:HDR128Wp [Eremothecium sinecaudum]|uniref:HDR128Wp n=1 Tax=Eremothecium sinecaudum TaxID=45286 RepID=A0A0X8HSZ0_9SACH|nr:HDR128Wp [Eremothecium sinecaudum]AMD20870.1 HDR128Wp [Eremothecium sinecaudum]
MSSAIQAIGPVKSDVSKSPISDMPKLIIGGATLMPAYNKDPLSIPQVEIVRRAMASGINAIDTSPYYGDSEVIFGRVLEELKEEFPRQSYYLCTKVGRIGLEKFDYSKQNVRSSVRRSCEILKTDYLDLVYLHDIEFVEFEGIWEALRELRKLKDEGIIRNFGVSGYPVDLLYHVAKKSCNMPDIGPLDAVLSYCNLNLQSLNLLKYADRLFSECKLKTVSNASITSMGLLTSFGPVSSHPCTQELRQCSKAAAELATEQGIELGDLATRYAIAKWNDKGPTVLGLSRVEQLEQAVKSYQTVMANGGKLDEKDQKLVETIQKDCFGDRMNEMWESGIPHDLS